MKKALLIFTVGTLMFSCGKSACDCKKESEEITSQSLREKFSGDYNESKDKLKDLDEDCEDYSKEDYKDCD